MSKKKVLLRGVFINRDTNGEGVLKVGTTLIRVSTVMGILYRMANTKFDKLIGLLEPLENNSVGEWIIDKEHKGTEDDPKHFPWDKFGNRE